MSKPSRTINKLHFEDLDPIRFEDLSLSLIYRVKRWSDINHYGKKGSDDGIDIQAVEDLENGKQRTWYFQCKRYQKILKGDIRSVVDRVVNKNDEMPHTLVLIVSCDVSKRNIEFFKSYSEEFGIENSIIWTSSIIEAKLYAEYHDLLFAYFGVNLNEKRRNRIATVRRNIELKKRMRRDFTKKSTQGSDPWDLIRNPSKQFISSEFLIRSVDDTFYPDNIPDEFGNYPWYKVESHDFYHNGLLVVTGIVEIAFNINQKWEFAKNVESKRIETGELKTINAVEVSKIPFENIITYDIDGDEFYIYPHIFCDFSHMGNPYEGVEYYITGENQRRIFLDYEDQGL